MQVPQALGRGELREDGVVELDTTIIQRGHTRPYTLNQVEPAQEITQGGLFISNAFAKQIQFGLPQLYSPLGDVRVAVLRSNCSTATSAFVSRGSKEMSDLCPVYAPFFGAMVGTQLLCVCRY